jgi:hypothetical protein
MHIGQDDVSRLERRTGMYVSILAGFFNAVGEDLEICGIFSETAP